jgi:hypothetical protein
VHDQRPRDREGGHGADREPLAATSALDAGGATCEAKPELNEVPSKDPCDIPPAKA